MTVIRDAWSKHNDSSTVEITGTVGSLMSDSNLYSLAISTQEVNITSGSRLADWHMLYNPPIG